METNTTWSLHGLNIEHISIVHVFAVWDEPRPASVEAHALGVDAWTSGGGLDFLWRFGAGSSTTSENLSLDVDEVREVAVPPSPTSENSCTLDETHRKMEAS